MVNFKAAGHQGERKRSAALAATDAAVGAAVSKNEKRHLLERPWSNADPLCRSVVNAEGIALQVVARERLLPESNAMLKLALVDAAAHAHLHQKRAAAGTGGRGAPLVCRPGGDFVLEARAHECAGAGEIALSEAQRLSLRVCEGEVYEWVPFAEAATGAAAGAPPLPELSALEVEVQLLEPPAEGAEPLRVESAELGAELANWLFGQPVSMNELFIISHRSRNLVARVVDVAAEADDDDDETDETGGQAAASTAAAGTAAAAATTATGVHCYRGSVGAATQVYLGQSTRFKSSASQRAVSEGLVLCGGAARPARRRRNVLTVNTSDGEAFPVNRRLLRPCIALTAAVRSRAIESTEVTVAVDTATFDRVLLFLEASAAGRAEQFAFEIASLEALHRAAHTLQLRQLMDACERKLGDFQSRVRMHHWDAVVSHNEGGGCWVTMDAMLFDLEAWLPEHPGGATIIPQQALNKDCTVFFELYHASRESFEYLREFYIGELWPQDRDLVPREQESASADFMQQLQDYCKPFRLVAEEAEQASSAGHLGGARSAP